MSNHHHLVLEPPGLSACFFIQASRWLRKFTALRKAKGAKKPTVLLLPTWEQRSRLVELNVGVWPYDRIIWGVVPTQDASKWRFSSGLPTGNVMSICHHCCWEGRPYLGFNNMFFSFRGDSSKNHVHAEMITLTFSIKTIWWKWFRFWVKSSTWTPWFQGTSHLWLWDWSNLQFLA